LKHFEKRLADRNWRKLLSCSEALEILLRNIIKTRSKFMRKQQLREVAFPSIICVSCYFTVDNFFNSKTFKKLPNKQQD
jgi:hypothetical protein